MSHESRVSSHESRVSSQGVLIKFFRLLELISRTLCVTPFSPYLCVEKNYREANESGVSSHESRVSSHESGVSSQGVLIKFFGLLELISRTLCVTPFSPYLCVEKKLQRGQTFFDHFNFLFCICFLLSFTFYYFRFCVLHKAFIA